jgi:hypothetical protein
MATFTKVTKNIASWTKGVKTLSGNSYLLQEDNTYILLEDGSKIILEQSTPASPTWTKVIKN